MSRARSTQAVAAELDRCLRRTGPDGGRVVDLVDTIIGYRAFHVSAERCGAGCQPVRWGGNLVLAWDGRLDNAGDLIAELGHVREAGQTGDSCVCDAHLVMRAFVRWGEAFVEHLVGDYSLGLWDIAREELYLARDPFGLRPLYLCRLAGEAWWSSEIAFLLAVVNDSFPLDENFVAGYLTTTEEPHQTPYRGIQSVTPGTLVRVRRNQLETRTFWRPEPKRTIRYRGDGEYEEHFRELFSDSLRCRLRAKGAVMCELSGGLDSSAIVCTADRLVRAGKTEATRLETVSFLYDESRTSDESAFINEVIQATGLQNHRVIDRRILSDALVHEDYFFPNPHRSYLDTFAQTEQLMRKSGARVLLSGACGDHVFMHDQGYYPILAELLTHGKFWYAHRLTKSLSRQTKNSYWRTLWLGAVWPWLPVQWRLTLSPERMRLPDWVEEDFAVRTQCHERNLLRKEVQSYSNPCLQQRLSLVWNAISASSSHRYREHQCVEISMPYLHMPLVHFLIEIPSDQLLRPGEDRSIQRRSMAGILPERIRIRKGKRSPDEAFLRAVRRHWPHLREVCRNAVSVRLGIINGPRFYAALERASFGQAKFLGSLFRTISFELWLQSGAGAKRLSL